MRKTELFSFLSFVGCVGVAVVLVACSSSSDGAKTPNGGTNGQAGTGARAGSSAQGGSNAQAGSTASNGGNGTTNGGNGTTGGGGATGGTTGTSGAAGSVGQAGSAGSSSADACKTALFCDDFEKYTAGSPPGAPWTNNATAGTVAVDATHVHSGTHAVKFSAAVAPSTATYRSVMINLQKATFLPPPGNVFYGRMMFWLDSAPQTSVHWTFLDALGKVPGQTYRALYRYGGQLPITNGADFVGSQLMANYDTPDSYASPAVGPKSDCWQHADKTVVPVAQWACAEWKFDGANKMQFWLNGTEITSLAMTGTGQGCVNQTGPFPWSAPSFDRIDLGWESYQADDARNMWIDDVAISTTKIGCPP